MQPPTSLWRRAEEPVAAHDLALALLPEAGYARARGIAQQAARLARAGRLDRAGRRRLLAAAWLCETGAGLGPGLPGLELARALRRAGQEPLARIVAHSGCADLAAALAGGPPPAGEFPRPGGGDGALVTLLDIARVTTAADGSRATPAAALRAMAAGAGRDDLRVRLLVALVARLADDPAARRLVERVAAPAA